MTATEERKRTLDGCRARFCKSVAACEHRIEDAVGINAVRVKHVEVFVDTKDVRRACRPLVAKQRELAQSESATSGVRLTRIEERLGRPLAAAHGEDDDAGDMWFSF